MSYPGTVSVKTAPTVEPLSLEEVKLHLRVDHTEEDTLIYRLLKMARETAEKDYDLALITQSLQYRLDDWPEDEPFYLPKPPLQSITSIGYYDTAGVAQTILASNYELDIYSQPGRVRPIPDYSWPDVQDKLNAITIEYKAGFGATASTVPEELRQALLLLIGNYYEHRESVIVGTISNEIESVTARYILQSFRTGWSF
jgi:uncharacterized phiE125 gp8 family phage protein